MSEELKSSDTVSDCLRRLQSLEARNRENWSEAVQEQYGKQLRKGINISVGRVRNKFERRLAIYKATVKRLKRRVRALKIAATYDEDTLIDVPEQLREIRGLREFLFPHPAIGLNESLVYLLVDCGEVVYVGQTTTGFSRPMAHLCDKVFQRAFFVPCLVRNLDECERHYIAMFLPRYNNDSTTRATRKSKVTT